MSSTTWVPPEEEEPRDTYGHDGSWEVITTCDPLEEEPASKDEPDEPDEADAQSQTGEDEAMEETLPSLIEVDNLFNTLTFTDEPISGSSNDDPSFSYFHPTPALRPYPAYSHLPSRPASVLSTPQVSTFPQPSSAHCSPLPSAYPLFQPSVVNTNPECHPDLVEISFGNPVVQDLPPLKPPSPPAPRQVRNLSHVKKPDYLTDDEVDMTSPCQPYRPPAPPPPPPSKPESRPPTFASLSAGAKAGKLVFRVHTATSFSPLQWSGHPSTSGFGSANWHLADLTPTGYSFIREERQRDEQGNVPVSGNGSVNGNGNGNNPSSASGVNAIAVKGNRYAATTGSGPRAPWANWLSGPVMRQNLVDHILGKPRLTAVDPGEGNVIPADAHSPFISASADLEWVVWDVARRIALGEEEVHLAIIAIEPPKGPTRDTSGATGELVADPLPPLTAHRRMGRGTGERGRMTHSEKDNVDNAIAGASASSEVLFYGRVFADSIVSNLTFEPKGLGTPFELPKYMQREGRGGWIDRLVWCVGDDYATAKQKMAKAKGSSRAKSSRSRTSRDRW